MAAMRWSAAFVLMLVGCGLDDDGPTSMEMPPDETLPAGVWEPYRGAHIVDASFAIEGDTVWWATSRRISDPAQDIHETALWLHATSPSGESIVEPVRFGTDEDASWSPDVVVTPSAIVVSGRDTATQLRRFDRDGQPLGGLVPIPLANGATTFETPDETTLVTTPTGGVKIVATLRYEANEVAVVDVDASGAVASTLLAGARDTVEPGGSASGSVAAAMRDDGSLLVGWSRYYYACVTDRPPLTLTTSVSGGVAAPLAQVYAEESGELNPVIATKGDGAFVAWQNWTADGDRISIARYPDVTTVLAELPGPNPGYPYGMYAVALSGPDRGALAVRSSDTHIAVTPFSYQDGAILLGTPTLQPLVDGEGGATLVGLRHIGGDRYVLAWREPEAIGAERERLFATELELVTNTMRPAPPSSAPATRPSRLRCP